ncbi:MAG: hypothetical protein KGQ59_04170 [Bdellovibrionales bacterium]|nr:hypothetical protein [Bdellovibrionales bacterium]
MEKYFSQTNTRSLKSQFLHYWGPLFFVISFVVFLVDIFWGFWDHDSGYYFTQASLVAHGLRPYVDYKTLYPPLFSILHAIPIKLGISREWLIWSVPLIWVTAISLLSVIYFYREWSRTNRENLSSAPWILGALYFWFSIDFGGNHLTLEHGIAFFGLLALNLESSAILPQISSKNRYFLIGVCLGLALLTKQVALLLFFPFLFAAIRRREWPVILFGIVTPLILFFLWIGFNLLKVQESFALLTQYLGSSKPLRPSDWLKSFFMILIRDGSRTPPGFLFLTLVLVLPFAHLLRNWRQRDYTSLIWAFSWVLVCAGYFAARCKNNFPHYTLNCWPAICVCLLSCREALRSPQVRKWVIVASLIVLCRSILSHNSIRTLDNQPYLTRWRNGGRLTEFLFPVARELKTLIPVHAKVTHLGLEEEALFFLSERLPLNKDWSPYDLRAPIEGDGLLINGFNHSWISSQRETIHERGYQLRNRWRHPEGDVELYWKESSPPFKY